METECKGLYSLKQYFCENYNAERRLSSRLGLSKYLTRWFFCKLNAQYVIAAAIIVA